MITNLKLQKSAPTFGSMEEFHYFCRINLEWGNGAIYNY